MVHVHTSYIHVYVTCTDVYLTSPEPSEIDRNSHLNLMISCTLPSQLQNFAVCPIRRLHCHPSAYTAAFPVGCLWTMLQLATIEIEL